jgi:translation initiation factor 2 subunit 2
VVDYASLDTEFVLPLKKKQKREKVAEEFALDAGEAAEATEVDPSQYVDTSAWAGSTRDYLYSELLERAFDIMRSKNPGAVQGEKRRFVMKPPQVIRLGSKKSGFINFVEICKLMHRTPDHVLSYLLAELGTSGTLDGSDVLVLKGRFQQKQMESVLRRYIREYVTCTTCRSPDTILSRANRMFFLTCETCAARYSVSTISAGYSAVVGRRSRIRAAQGN